MIKFLSSQEIADIVAYLKQSTLSPDASPIPSAKHNNRIPPQRAIKLPGLHAYAQKSIAAGTEIEFRVSSSVPYETERSKKLGSEPENRDNDPVLATFPDNPAKVQPIHPGSYVHVENGLPTDRPLTAMTLECWVRPFSLSGWQGLITQHDYPEACGIGLLISDGKIAFHTDSGGKFTASCLH